MTKFDILSEINSVKKEMQQSLDRVITMLYNKGLINSDSIAESNSAILETSEILSNNQDALLELVQMVSDNHNAITKLTETVSKLIKED